LHARRRHAELEHALRAQHPPRGARRRDAAPREVVDRVVCRGLACARAASRRDVQPAVLDRMSPRLVAAAIFVVTVVTRVPFATAHLYAWDSTLYARALEHGFRVTADPATESPHPPGYIWYVAVAALVRLAVHDSNAALV